MNQTVIKLPVKNRKRSYTDPEIKRLKIMTEVSESVRKSGKRYKDIANATGLSPSTIGAVARMDTIWPRPVTMFTLMDYFGMELEVKHK